MIASAIPQHVWVTDRRWTPVKSLDTHQRTVRQLWPDAVQEFVRSVSRTGYGLGLVHRIEGRIVAEVRDLGRQRYEEWIEEPEQQGKGHDAIPK
jgi:hypothetical protein